MYSSIVKKIHRHPLSLPERTHVHDIFNVLYDDLHNGLFDELQAGLYDGPLIPLYEGLYFDLVTASTTASIRALNLTQTWRMKSGDIAAHSRRIAALRVSRLVYCRTPTLA